MPAGAFSRVVVLSPHLDDAVLGCGHLMAAHPGVQVITVFAERAPTLVLLPFGLANPDHACVHDAALMVRERMPSPIWCCYEDSGYKHIPGLLAWRVSRLFRAGLWPTPQAVPVATDTTAKAAALAHYTSQLRALETDWAISEKLAAPAPEQCWRLDPPPDGWEGLAAG